MLHYTSSDRCSVPEQTISSNIRSIFITISLILLLCSFGIISHNSGKGTALVNQVSGLYIFTDCRPAGEFYVLGTVEVKYSRYGPQYGPVRDALIKKVREKYPAANGAVLTFNNGAPDMADAILIK